VGAVTATVVAVTAGSGVDAVAAAGVPCRVGAEAWMDAVAEWRGTKPPCSAASRKPATVPGPLRSFGKRKGNPSAVNTVRSCDKGLCSHNPLNMSVDLSSHRAAHAAHGYPHAP